MPALRVTGPYLAMVTIAFGFVVEQGACFIRRPDVIFAFFTLGIGVA